MSSEGTKHAGCASGEDEEWLYGENDEDYAYPNDDDDEKTETEVFRPLIGDVEGVNGEGNQDGDANSDSDSDDDDDGDVCITIGDIKTGGGQSISTPVNLNIRTSGRVSLSGMKTRGAALDAKDSAGGTLLEVDVESFEEKPWRKPGADLSDYFNYGFNEDTWKAYCDKQRRLRMSLEVSRGDLSSKSDNSSRKPNSSINVVGGQTGTISRVEGRRHHISDDSNTQVQPSSEHSSDAELQSSKLQSFFPPNIPPPPFPPLSISTPSPFIPPPPRFPVPPGVPSPPTLRTSQDSAHSRGSHSAPLYPFSADVYPPLLRTMVSWCSIMDSTKAWDYYYSRHDEKRERDKDRERTRDRDRDRDRERERHRQREREHTPLIQSRSSDEDYVLRHRDHSYRERERHQEHAGGAGEREDRHRERRHRERNERHKSSRSSYSRSSHASGDGESHRRHKSSRRNKDSTEPSEERDTDRDHRSEPTK